MYILAYKDGHDPAACLLKDGEIIAAVEEERFTRTKHAPGIFPEQSIKFCLDRAGIKPSDVDHVVYARFTPIRTLFAVFAYYLTRPPRSAMEWRYFVSHMKVQFDGSIRQLFGIARYQTIRKRFPGLPKQVAPYEHHLCHAASAFLFSPFEEALVITWDGKGEATSLTVGEGKGADLHIHRRRGIFDSLGLLYSSATAYLGFTPNDGEYKVMGLAPYGARGRDLSAIIRATDDGYVVDSKYVLYPFSVNSFSELFGKRKKGAELTEDERNIAYALQESLEEAGLSVVKAAGKARYACFAGGVALNVKLNRVIRESGLFEDIFVQPASGDDGLVLGAAGLHYARLAGKRPQPITNMYFGSSYGDEEIACAFDERGIRYKKVDAASQAAADLLAEHKVLAWYQHRMEFGPRALGSRSVIANPAKESTRDLVNAKIKFREDFRPFCPSILSEQAKRLLVKASESPYMILSYEATPEAKRLMPAVVHVDNTVRPQTVAKNSPNTAYRKLLEIFYDKTGVPGVLNTSMNIRGEPIVESPENLAEFFIKTNVDAVVAGNIVAIRSDQDPEIFETLSRETLQTEY